VRALALALLLLMPSPAWAAEYPPNSVGKLLYGYGEAFSGGWITGFIEAFFLTGGECPMSVSASMLQAALRMHVQAGRIALTDNDQLGVVKSLTALGCTHPAGTKKTTL
jgi:hypothetical protein